jgi:hypothetical protein
VFKKLRYDNLTSAVKKILRGHRREETTRFVAFRSNSKRSLGLQLADIAATSLRRALNGNLARPGWEAFGKLLIKQPGLPFCMIGTTPRSTKLEGPGKAVWDVLAILAKDLLASSPSKREST